MLEQTSKSFNIHTEALEAENRIRPHIRKTFLEFSPYLSKISGGKVYLKLENMQLTGSFKLRGALNKILSLKPDIRKKGIITASTGNHGAAAAYIGKKFNIPVTIYLPKTASKSKIENLRLFGPEILLHGDDCIQAEMQAKTMAEQKGQAFVSPYNDIKIIGGQATIGIELEDQLDHYDVILCPVGGGGLISGLAGYLKANNTSLRIIGCQPKNSHIMYASIQAGRIIDEICPPTLSDGTAGGIEQESITFNICQDLVDDFILLTEEEIRTGLLLIMEKHSLLIEGAAALSVAAFLQNLEYFSNQAVILVLSGSRIGKDTLKQILC